MDWIGDLGMAAAATAIVSMVLDFIAGNQVLWLVTAMMLSLWALHFAPGKFRFSGRVRLGIMAAVVLYFLWAMVLFTIEQWRGPVAATAPPTAGHGAVERSSAGPTGFEDRGGP